MPDNYDRHDTESRGGAFFLGLLAGTVLGAGLGMLLAPKSGAELREELGERTRTLSNKASEQYRKAQESAGEWAVKGRDLADRVRDAASRGVAEMKNYNDSASVSASGPNGGAAPGDFGRS